MQAKITREWESRVSNYEIQIRQFSDERDDLQRKLRETTNELNELKRRMQDYAEVNRKLSEYENRIALMSQ